VPRHAGNAASVLVAGRTRLTVADAVAKLDVSEATIRRDFDALARQQLVSRTRGGVVATSVAYDLPLRYKTARNAEAKERIGSVAAQQVRLGEVVGLNGGTTTSALARAVAARPDLAEATERPAVTVVTNALNIATELVLRPYVKTVTTGGVARPQSYELIGPLATRLLEELHLDVAFIGVNGLDLRGGATAHHEGEAGINALMARRARRVVVVADATKLGRVAFARICALEQIDSVVTDRAADGAVVDAIEMAGVEVVRA